MKGKRQHRVDLEILPLSPVLLRGKKLSLPFILTKFSNTRKRKSVFILYTDISSCICTNGVRLDFFALERGVRQRDRLSPYLFITAVEILAITIRTNNNTQGINIENDEFELLQYAKETI